MGTVLHIVKKDKTAVLCGRKKVKRAYDWEKRKLAVYSEYDVCFACLKRIEK